MGERIVVGFPFRSPTVSGYTSKFECSVLYACLSSLPIMKINTCSCQREGVVYKFFISTFHLYCDTWLGYKAAIFLISVWTRWCRGRVSAYSARDPSSIPGLGSNFFFIFAVSYWNQYVLNQSFKIWVKKTCNKLFLNWFIQYKHWMSYSKL